MTDAVPSKNAIISSTMLGYQDHGILSFWLYLDYGGGSQGFGGLCLDDVIKNESGLFKARGAHKICGFVLQRILETLEVETWERLPKTHVRVIADHDRIHAIGHFLKDQWFYLDEAKKVFE